MRPFDGFTCKAIVIVPTDEDFKDRCEKRTSDEGKDIPEHAVMEMKGRDIISIDWNKVLLLFMPSPVRLFVF